MDSEYFIAFVTRATIFTINAASRHISYRSLASLSPCLLFTLSILFRALRSLITFSLFYV